jgi:hypothetical protein
MNAANSGVTADLAPVVSMRVSIALFMMFSLYQICRVSSVCTQFVKERLKTIAFTWVGTGSI